MKKLYEHLADTGVQIDRDIGVIVEGYRHPNKQDWGYLAGKVGRVLTYVPKNDNPQLQDFDPHYHIILIDAQQRMSRLYRTRHSVLRSFRGGGLMIDDVDTRVICAQTPLFVQTAQDLAAQVVAKQ